ncbi:MAG: hypothetical protein J3R72DRAFT_53338 [Linnemannia gamsii]|nr:MAG: hypothetical protein J3R72DRAFT_53338 [Linnemannia gamsii]
MLTTSTPFTFHFPFFSLLLTATTTVHGDEKGCGSLLLSVTPCLPLFYSWTQRTQNVASHQFVCFDAQSSKTNLGVTDRHNKRYTGTTVQRHGRDDSCHGWYGW